MTPSPSKRDGGRKANKSLHGEKHPSNNMGAEITAPSENQVLIDWLSWTLKTLDPDDAIKQSGLSCLSFSDSKGGGMGYKSSKRAGNIVVFYDGAENMGCHISMSGQGCRQYEAAKKTSHCWYQLLTTLSSINANISRLDIALDNVDGQLDLDRLQYAISKKEIRSIFKGGHKYEKFSFGEENENGLTIYIGSPTSRLKFRFYDKAAQYHIENQHWVRCELQLMAERAQEAVKHLLKSVEPGQLAVSVLNNYFTVINLDDSNKSRCSTKCWWTAWLTTTDKLRLTTMKAIKTVIEVMDHIKRQYGASFAMCKKFLGVVDFHEYVHEVIDYGKERMNKKHQMIIEISKLELEPLPF